ncbi:hypothetical protein [Aquimarina sp. AU58]|uniref:hypothetical protein n=1 Tax=Aquimarina sp. AU58 TaxID=1874112 RepID=UPI000D6E585A|nr:hypothetical protein [Aquimarina sp. AU58]
MKKLVVLIILLISTASIAQKIKIDVTRYNPLTGAPVNPQKGWVYYGDDDNLYKYNGSQWIVVGAPIIAGSGIVNNSGTFDWGGGITKNTALNLGAFNLTYSSVVGTNEYGGLVNSSNYNHYIINNATGVTNSISINDTNLSISNESNGGDDSQSILLTEDNVKIRSIGTGSRHNVTFSESNIVFDSSTGAVNSNNLEIGLDGVIKAPSMTNSEVDSATDDVLIPKGYADANYGGGSSVIQKHTETLTDHVIVSGPNIQILPSPGIDKVYDIISISISKNLTTAYNNDVGYRIYMGNGVVSEYSVANSEMRWNFPGIIFHKLNITDYDGDAGDGNTVADTVGNSALNLSFFGASATGGVGTIKVNVVYTVIDL